MSASTPEGKVKKQIKAVLDKYKPDVWYFMPRGSSYGRSGIPDFVCCICGSFVGIEAKAGRGHPSPLQTMELEAIRVAEGFATVVYEDDIEALENSVVDLIERSKNIGTD